MSLIISNLGKKYGRQWIVRDLNLEVSDGECVALLGPSGCGKSTTLRLIAGLEKLDEGSIFINGRNIEGISSVNRKVGMVFQSYALFPHLSVAENLLIGLKIRKISKPERIRKVSDVLRLMKLEDYSNQLPAKLSGGQRQRVALARALLRDPDIYLLDEPMSNLDAQLREDLRPELRSIILNGNQPIIYVTHDQHEAMAISNRIALLNKGSIEQIGTPQELYEKPRTLFVASFIGRPQINIFRDNPNFVKCVRPEDIKISTTGIKCSIAYKEWLGSSQLLVLNTAKGQIRMMSSCDEVFNDEFYVDWSQDKEHCFDSKSYARLTL